MQTHFLVCVCTVPLTVNIPVTQLGEVMGEGEFGPVLRGVARQLVRGEEHTEVAVKMLMRREGEELLTRNILTEFVNQMNLSSPNICTILGLCTDAEPYYIIYQYLDKVRFTNICTELEAHQFSYLLIYLVYM